MKQTIKTICLLLCVVVCTLTKAQQVVYVTSSNSELYKSNKNQLIQYNEYTTKFAKLTKEFRYRYFREGKWKFGNEEEWSCLCGADNDDTFTYLDPVEKPKLIIEVYPKQVPVVKVDTVIQVRYKTKILRDTVFVEKIYHDTTKIVLGDTLKKVWFTTTDKITMLMKDSTGKSIIPYIERRYYDYENKLVGSVKLDPQHGTVLK